MSTVLTNMLAIVDETKNEIKHIFESLQSFPEKKDTHIDNLAMEIIRYENVSLGLSIMIKHFKDELFELKIGLIDDLLQKTISIINNGKNINLSQIKPNDIVNIFHGVQIYCAWAILTSFLYLNQKWINIQLKTIFALWQTHFVEGKLTLVKGVPALENYVTQQSMVEACNSMLVFLQNCPKLYTDNILKYIS